MAVRLPQGVVRDETPKGAEAGFRLTITDARGSTLTMHFYGAGRKGWYLVSRRSPDQNFEQGPTPLAKGQWRTFLNFIKQIRFWDLPVRWQDPTPDGLVYDGDELDLAGQEVLRFHQIHRSICREPGLDALLAFCLQVAGLKDHLLDGQSQPENANRSTPVAQPHTPKSPNQGREPG